MRVRKRYREIDINRDIETDLIRFSTIWFCTITRMNRRNLASLREWARRPGHGDIRVHIGGIFPVKSINPVEFSVAASERDSSSSRRPLCSSPIPFTTFSIPCLAGRKGKYVNESRRMRIDRIAAYTHRRCTNRWKFIGYSYGYSRSDIFSLADFLTGYSMSSNVLIRSCYTTMHYTETVVSLDRLDKLDLSC